MDKELQRITDADWRVYNSKDIMQALSITKDQFRNKSKRIKIVYGLDISKYRKSKEELSKEELLEKNLAKKVFSSNFTFNENEFEILKILFKNIDYFPIKITEQKFYDEDIRQKARDEKPQAFVSYITEMANAVDKIKNDDLKVHVYASKIYDDTMEWLTARQKLDKSISDFIRYTNSLEYTESAKRYRELAYRVDEMLFDLMKETDPDVSDIDISSQNLVIQKDPFDLENFYRRQENEKMRTPYASDRHRYSHAPDDNLLDQYIVNLLNEIFEKREEKQREIKKKYHRKNKPHDIDIGEFLTRENIELQEWELKDPKSLQLIQNHDENLNRIKHAVHQYKKNNYRLKDYKDKLQDIINDQQRLERNDYFKGPTQKFYKALQAMVLLADCNRMNFTKDGVSPEMIDHFINDTHRLFEIIEKYNISGEFSERGDRSKKFKQLHDEFRKIKNDKHSSDIINSKTADITSWRMAEKLLENLEKK